MLTFVVAYADACVIGESRGLSHLLGALAVCGVAAAASAGTQFTCFTGTNVQMLLLRDASCLRQEEEERKLYTPLHPTTA